MKAPSKGNSIARLVHHALHKRVFTGASVLIARAENILYKGLFGWASSKKDILSENHFFDLASLTKPIAIASLYLYALDRRIVLPSTRLGEILPSRWTGSFSDVEIFDLLSHRSGLPAYRELYKVFIKIAPERRKALFVKNILASSRVSDKKAIYSDLGYIVLGYVLEKIFNASLSELFNSVFLSYSIVDAGKLSFVEFNYPLAAHIKPPIKNVAENEIKFVSTSFCKWRNRRLVGEVDDANAFCLGGVAGHAGLFGTSDGIFEWLLHLWKIYSGRAQGLCSQELLHLFLRERNDGYSWVAGFDTPSPDSDMVAPFFSSKSIGHYGFTGTSFWMDLTDGFMVIILTNRVYFNSPQTEIRTFRREVHRIARMEYGE